MNLRELILLRCDALGMTFRDVAARATGAGYPTSATTVWRLATYADNDLPEAPKRATLNGLAVALDVDPREVGLACMESLGLHSDGVTPTGEDVMRFEIAGNGWTAEQLDRFRRAAERAIRREQQATIRKAHETIIRRPRRTPNG